MFFIRGDRDIQNALNSGKGLHGGGPVAPLCHNSSRRNPGRLASLDCGPDPASQSRPQGDFGPGRNSVQGRVNAYKSIERSYRQGCEKIVFISDPK